MMRISRAFHQLDASTLLSLLAAIDVTWSRIRYFRFGVWHMPGVNDDPSDNAGRDDANRLAQPAPVSMPFHSTPNKAEARDNHGA